MSKNLAILGRYSARMAAGDYAAVYEVFAPDFVSHVTPRVSPEAVGTDIRPQEQKFWESARNAFSDMRFTVDLLIESGDLVVSNWTLTGTHDGAPYYGIPPSGRGAMARSSDSSSPRLRGAVARTRRAVHHPNDPGEPHH